VNIFQVQIVSPCCESPNSSETGTIRNQT
jgi:hypothetical protein